MLELCVKSSYFCFAMFFFGSWQGDSMHSWCLYTTNDLGPNWAADPRVTIVHHRCLFKIILLKFCNYALEKTYQAFVLLSFFTDIFVGDFAVQTLNFLSPLNCRYINLDIIICELCSLWSDFESCFKASEAYSGYHEHLLHHHPAKH